MYSANRPALFIAIALLAAGQVRALTWRWSNPSPHGNNVVDMAWDGNLAVQVTELGQIYTGMNFFGWLPQNSGTTNDLQAVVFLGNRIVFSGAEGAVGYSDDGVNFTSSSLNTANWLVSLAASSNLVVAVGDNAVIYTSSDGASWQYQGQAPNNPNGSWLLSAAWGAGEFVITGEYGYVATSADGVHWTSHSINSTPPFVTSDLTSVAWVSTTNAAFAFPYTGFWAATSDGRALYSTNRGAAWHLFSGLNSTNVLYAISANATSGLLAGEDDVRLATTAGLWGRQAGQLPGSAPIWTYYTAVWDTNGAYRLGGDDGMLVQGAATTNNNYIWQTPYYSVRDFLWQTTLASDLYVAVGDNARIMTSGNGVDWSIEAIPFTNSVSATNTVFFCVGGNSNMLVAAGNRGSLAVSPNNPTPVVITNLDGTTFTNLVGSMGVLWYSLPAPTTNDLTGVCTFSNNLYLAGGNATLLRSADGTNWTRMAVPSAGNTYISGLASSSNSFIAAGDQGLLLSSADGVNWSKITSGTTNWLFRVRCLNGRFLAIGETGTILQSTNGVNWSFASSGTTNWLNDAIMVSNTCYIVGNNGTVLASIDFVNWTNIGCITAQSLYGAATQNGQLVVVGLQGTILRSQILPDLTPVDFVGYQQAGDQNLFLVAGQPDQRFTLDSSTNLMSWVTGPVLDLIYGSGTLVFLTNLGTNPPPTQFYRATLVP
jgi:hypothetical protein